MAHIGYDSAIGFFAWQGFVVKRIFEPLDGGKVFSGNAIWNRWNGFPFWFHFFRVGIQFIVDLNQFGLVDFQPSRIHLVFDVDDDSGAFCILFASFNAHTLNGAGNMFANSCGVNQPEQNAFDVEGFFNGVACGAGKLTGSASAIISDCNSCSVKNFWCSSSLPRASSLRNCGKLSWILKY